MDPLDRMFVCGSTLWRASRLSFLLYRMFRKVFSENLYWLNIIFIFKIVILFSSGQFYNSKIGSSRRIRNSEY